ncbi:hypothetical protein SAV31267_006620 [Streptomyces avermitilis]|uniref:Uncharacterized protein n=1 Tax=Streptomyces avermitilis TaxID=33903 RepID=A0A4D4MIU0_STRAX|nr:hypothetical protein SAV31267_006620 [Streptomyces avermitilis]
MELAHFLDPCVHDPAEDLIGSGAMRQPADLDVTKALVVVREPHDEEIRPRGFLPARKPE